jgi:hypothetical protein
VVDVTLLLICVSGGGRAFLVTLFSVEYRLDASPSPRVVVLPVQTLSGFIAGVTALSDEVRHARRL